jgi:hypothetical protein
MRWYNMRRIKSITIPTLLGLVILTVCIPAVSANAGTMAMYVDEIDGTYGTLVDVPINVSGASDVGAMDIVLSYNSSVLSPNGFVSTGDVTTGALVINDGTIHQPECPEWTNATISETDNQTVWDYGALANYTGTSGVVNISIICNADDVGFNGAGSVAVVRFAVTGNGTSPLNLSVAAYNVSAPIPNATDPDKTDGYESITVTTTDGTFNTEGEDTYIISLVAGWNMVSIPVIPEDASVDAIFGDKITPPVYEYDAGYKSVTSLEPKKGYWVLTDSPADIEITGTAPANLEVTVYPGWNMIGPVSPDVQVSSFTGITPPVYGYDAGYKSVETLEQTNGYWVLTSAETTLTV